MSLCRFFSWDSWDSWDTLHSFCTLRARFYTCSFFALLGPFYFDASFCPFYMRTACVWSILLDLSVVFFFFCFLYHLCPIKINYQLSTIVCYGDISSATICFFGLLLWVLLLDRVGKLVVKAVWKLAYKQILVSICKRSKASKALKGFCLFFSNFIATVIIPHSFFSNALFKNSALVVFSHS